MIAPGIFDRANPPDGDGQSDTALFGSAVAALYAGDKMAGGLLAGHAWIRARAPKRKIGLYGNCMGGGLTLQAAAGNTNYAAVSELYGYARVDRKTTQPPPPDALAWAAHMTTPTIGFYGGADGGISTDDVKALPGRAARVPRRYPQSLSARTRGRRVEQNDCVV